jgi:hypothetical protein
MRLTFPVIDGVVSVPIPAGTPPEVAVAAARAAISAVACAEEQGDLRSGPGLGRSIAERRLALYETGNRAAYAVAAAADADQLAVAARVPRRNDEPEAAVVLDAILAPEFAAHLDPALGTWARTLIGHRTGAATGHEGCRLCRLAVDRHWQMLLAEVGVSNRLVLDFYRAAVSTGRLPKLGAGFAAHGGDFLTATGLSW